MDKHLVAEKLASIRRCLERIEGKLPFDASRLKEDFDLQDIVSVNLERAVQAVVDVCLHFTSESGMAAPASMSDAVGGMTDLGLMDDELAGRLQKAVGFRNIAVHEYQPIDWEIVFAIVRNHLGDFRRFIAAVLEALGRS